MKRKLFTSRRRKKQGKLQRFIVWSWRIVLVALILDLAYLIAIWPNWTQLRDGKIPTSRFMRDYQAQQGPMAWQPVKLTAIPQYLQHSIITAEDARFYSHHGFDLLAFKEAMDTNLKLKKLRYGASTISQQTTKNLFLTSSKNPLRKWHELILTLAMEMQLDKKRILEIYLNVAEFGKGVYGVQAASQHYWQTPIHTINQTQAIELAATLPSPVKDNPHTRTSRFLQRKQRIANWLAQQK